MAFVDNERSLWSLGGHREHRKVVVEHGRPSSTQGVYYQPWDFITIADVLRGPWESTLYERYNTLCMSGGASCRNERFSPEIRQYSSGRKIVTFRFSLSRLVRNSSRILLQPSSFARVIATAPGQYPSSWRTGPVNSALANHLLPRFLLFCSCARVFKRSPIS